jgi:hypothetical protein
LQHSWKTEKSTWLAFSNDIAVVGSWVLPACTVQIPSDHLPRCCKPNCVWHVEIKNSLHSKGSRPPPINSWPDNKQLFPWTRKLVHNYLYLFLVGWEVSWLLLLLLLFKIWKRQDQKILKKNILVWNKIIKFNMFLKWSKILNY